jgi:hypothetical protein
MDFLSVHGDGRDQVSYCDLKPYNLGLGKP